MSRVQASRSTSAGSRWPQRCFRNDKARATVTEGAERRRLLDAHQAAIPIFLKYESMTERELPVVALERLSEG